MNAEIREAHAACTQFLRNRDPRILFHGLEHDRRPGRRDRRRRGDLLAENLTEMLGIARAHLEQVAVVAGDVVDLEDFGDAGEL